MEQHRRQVLRVAAKIAGISNMFPEKVACDHQQNANIDAGRVGRVPESHHHDGAQLRTTMPMYIDRGSCASRRQRIAL